MASLCTLNENGGSSDWYKKLEDSVDFLNIYGALFTISQRMVSYGYPNPA